MKPTLLINLTIFQMQYTDRKLKDKRQHSSQFIAAIA